MKQWIIPAVVAALVIDLGVFAGVGFGLGALTLAPGLNTTTSNQYSPGSDCIPANAMSNWGGTWWALCVNASLPNIANTGDTPTSSILPGGISTPIDFAGSVQLIHEGGSIASSPNSCPASADMAGVDGDVAEWIFLLFPVSGGSPIDFNAQINGQPYSTSSLPGIGAEGIAYPLSTNGPFACPYTYSNDLSGTANPAIQQGTIELKGILPVSTLRVELAIQGHYCIVSGGSPAGDCQAAGLSYTTGGAFIDGNVWTQSTVTSVLVQSGASSMELLTPGGLTWNGGPPIQVSVTTGYDGNAQYELQLMCPSDRSCGGEPMPGYAVYPVPNFAQSKTYSWDVQPNTGQNSTDTNWNSFPIELLASYLGEAWEPVAIDVSPVYAPGMPSISFHSSGPFVYPRVGDTLTLTVSASPSSKSGAVSSILLWVYYMGPGDSLSNLPQCGSQWQTSGCPNGEPFTGSVSGGSMTVTFAFTVAPPGGHSLGIGIWARSVNSQAQESNYSKLQVQIVSSNCTRGDPACPTNSGTNTWQWLGPALLSAAFGLVAVLVALVGKNHWLIGGAAAAMAGLILLGYLWLWPVLFAAGGPLAPGLA